MVEGGGKQRYLAVCMVNRAVEGEELTPLDMH